MRVTVKPNTYIYLAVLVFLIPFPWLIGWLTAVIFHEFCHWLAVRLCGGTVHKLTVGLGGANMETGPMTERKRLLAVLSGPVGGAFLVFLGRWFPRLAICSWVLTVYNLLPLLPLDGGRALQILIKQNRIYTAVECAVLFCLTAVALYASFALGFGALPMLIVGILWLKNRKSPCKERICKVQ